MNSVSYTECSATDARTRNLSPKSRTVRSPVPVAGTSAYRADISSRSRLVKSGVYHANSGGANAHARRNPYARSTNTGRCYRACNTSFRYAHSLAINDRTGWGGGESQANSQGCSYK